MKYVHYIALALGIIGAINWGLIGLFHLNLVTLLFGVDTMLTRIVYVLVGISGIWMLSFFPKLNDDKQY